MDRRQLEEAIASARRTNRTSLPARLHVGLFATHAQNARLRIRAARLYLGEIALGRLVSLLRTPGPLRAVILSAATLATGVLGVLVAYAVVPQESAAAQDGVQLVTITGPGGTRTVAVTRTKEGITKVVPVRVLRTVTGPEGVSTIAVTGPSLTDTEVTTQVQSQHPDAGPAQHRDQRRNRDPAGDGRRDRCRDSAGDRRLDRHGRRDRDRDGDCAPEPAIGQGASSFT